MTARMDLHLEFCFGPIVLQEVQEQLQEEVHHRVLKRCMLRMAPTKGEYNTCDYKVFESGYNYDHFASRIEV